MSHISDAQFLFFVVAAEILFGLLSLGLQSRCVFVCVCVPYVCASFAICHLVLKFNIVPIYTHPRTHTDAFDENGDKKEDPGDVRVLQKIVQKSQAIMLTCFTSC